MECPGGREGSNYGVVAARGVDGNTDEADSMTAQRRASRSSHSMVVVPRNIHEATTAPVEWLQERCAGHEVRSRRWWQRRGVHQELVRVRDEVSVSYRYRWAVCWTLEWAADLNQAEIFWPV